VRLAVLVTRMHPLGGAQVHVRHLTIALQAQGHSCTVVTTGEGPLVDDLRSHRVPVVLLRHLRRSIHPVRDLLALREIRAVIKHLRCELVTTHMSKAGLLGRLAVRPLGIPIVVTAHGWAFTPGIPLYQAALYRKVERSAGHLADRFIAVSEFDRQLALEAGLAGEDRVITVHNGVPDIAAGLRAKVDQAPVRLVMVARMDAQKDQPTLLRALAGLQNYEWNLDLVGDGDNRTRVESLASSLGIRRRIRFLGQRTDVDQILASAQISLLITNWEGFPMVILEAMRAGLPVVATSVGGSGEAVVHEQTGFLVPRGSVEVLRDRIRTLLTEPELRMRMGAAARSRYEQYFTLEHTVSRTCDVYRDVIEQRR
jgi:glycosyltransferase involved in cell wall biosynthesis